MSVSHSFDLAATSSFSKFQALVDARMSEEAGTSGASQPDFEVAVMAQLKELVREVLKRDLERHDLDVAGVTSEGRTYRRKHRCKKTYLTTAGPVEVERTVYVERGGHGGESLVPLELRLGLVDGVWSQRAAEIGCRYMEEATSSKSSELLALHGGMSPPASHLDRLPKVVNAVWEQQRAALEGAVRELDVLPEAQEVAVILASVDGVMVPMKDAPRSKTADGPKGHREAGCGTLCLLAANSQLVVQGD